MLSLIEFFLFVEAVVAEKYFVMVSVSPDGTVEALLPSFFTTSACSSYEIVEC